MRVAEAEERIRTAFSMIFGIPLGSFCPWGALSPSQLYLGFMILKANTI